MDLPDIIETGVDTRRLFSVEILENGQYAAVREAEPMFFMIAPTIAEASQKAEDALNSYRRMKTGN